MRKKATDFLAGVNAISHEKTNYNIADFFSESEFKATSQTQMHRERMMEELQRRASEIEKLHQQNRVNRDREIYDQFIGVANKFADGGGTAPTAPPPWANKTFISNSTATGQLRGANPTQIVWDEVPDEANAEVFRSIKDKTIIDIGVNRSVVCVTFLDGGILNVRPNLSCKLMEQNDLSQLNGQPLGDIVVNPQYSIAGDMGCMLILYTRFGVSISFAVFGPRNQTFSLEYTHAKS